MKKGIIIMIIAIILILIFSISYKLNLDKSSVLTCIRKNKDKVVIKFDSNGIKSLEINEKKASEEEFTLYQIHFIYDFSKIEVNEENYTEHELIQKYMKIVSNFEENNETYKSICSYER